MPFVSLPKPTSLAEILQACDTYNARAEEAKNNAEMAKLAMEDAEKKLQAVMDDLLKSMPLEERNTKIQTLREAQALSRKFSNEYFSYVNDAMTYATAAKIKNGQYKAALEAQSKGDQA